jgi:lipoprotein-anchoring transpeptidase ErfK/SrfK
MHLAIRQLSALYLTAASAYTVAIILSHHPALADRAGEASAFVRGNGAEATATVDSYVVEPGLRFVRSETAALTGKLMMAFETPLSNSEPRRLAVLPHAAHRLSANFVRLPHLRVMPSTQALPSASAQLAPPVPPTPPSTDDNGLRTGDVGQASNNAAPGAGTTEPPDASAPFNPSMANVVPKPAPQPRVAQVAAPRNQMQIASGADASPSPADNTPGAATATPNLPPPTSTEIAQVEQRLKDNLTSEMFNNFELFLYVSKASAGPWSQRMFVFQKEPTGDLALAYNWPVSTGREKIEFNASGQKLPSFTPSGYFELDPHRFYPHYVSGQWGEQMPHAMFFNWKKGGEDTGLAIHGAAGDDVGLLGTRASAGCVRLPPEAARTLFALIKSKYRGLAPQFAIDRRTGTMSSDGIIVHDSSGKVQLADGYKVLVFIEDYGGENVVAAMY